MKGNLPTKYHLPGPSLVAIIIVRGTPSPTVGSSRGGPGENTFGGDGMRDKSGKGSTACGIS